MTHDQPEAMTLSTKVAVLNQGLIQQLDPPSRIYSHPANEFVASFVGSPQMNLITVKCQHNQALLGTREIPVPFATEASHLVLGIRPEDLSLATSDDSLTVKGKVFLVEQLGKENLVSMQIEGTKITMRVLLTSDQDWEAATLTLALPEAKLHWFDVDTGDRLGS